jgi:hypothetical protein
MQKPKQSKTPLRQLVKSAWQPNNDESKQRPKQTKPSRELKKRQGLLKSEKGSELTAILYTTIR